MDRMKNKGYTVWPNTKGGFYIKGKCNVMLKNKLIGIHTKLKFIGYGLASAFCIPAFCRVYDQLHKWNIKQSKQLEEST